MTDDPFQIAAERLREASARTGIACQAECFHAFAQLFSAMPELPDREHWEQADQDLRKQWLWSYDQLVNACGFMVANLGEDGSALEELEQSRDTLSAERAELREQRDTLAAEIDVRTKDTEQLRDEIALLERVRELAAARKHLHDGQDDRVGRRRANDRLAAQVQTQIDELSRLGGEIDEREARREQLLKDNLEQSDTFWKEVVGRVT